VTNCSLAQLLAKGAPGRLFAQGVFDPGGVIGFGQRRPKAV